MTSTNNLDTAAMVREAVHEITLSTYANCHVAHGLAYLAHRLTPDAFARPDARKSHSGAETGCITGEAMEQRIDRIFGPPTQDTANVQQAKAEAAVELATRKIQAIADQAILDVRRELESG